MAWKGTLLDLMACCGFMGPFETSWCMESAKTTFFLQILSKKALRSNIHLLTKQVYRTHSIPINSHMDKTGDGWNFKTNSVIESGTDTNIFTQKPEMVDLILEQLDVFKWSFQFIFKGSVYFTNCFPNIFPRCSISKLLCQKDKLRHNLKYIRRHGLKIQ